MPYPTGTLSKVLEDADRKLIQLDQLCQQWINRLAAGPTSAQVILNIYMKLRAERASLTSAAATPGIGPFAQQQKDDPELDVVAEFNATIAAIDGVANWIAANFPKDSNNFLLAFTLGVNELVWRDFTAVQTAGLRVELQTIVDQIA